MTKLLKKYKTEVLLLTFMAIYTVYFTTASFLRYENYYTGRFDLGNMAQTVWNTSHGEIFLLTNPNGTEDISRLAFHADFILILLAPLYLIWSDPRMLLLIQTLILAFGAVFVYLIAKHLLKDKTISLIFALSYLLYPGVEYTNLYDFHAVAFATTFLLGAIYFLLKKNYAPMFLFLFFAGLTKENVWAIDALFGIYILVFHKKYKLGAFMAVAGVFLFYYLVWKAIPHALGNQHFALTYYSDFGATPSGIIRNMFLSPLKTLKTAFGPDQLHYLRDLFVPLGYASFLAPLFLIFTIPSFAINLLSGNSQLHQIYYQYSSSITPFIFFSSVFGLKIVNKRIPQISLKILACLILIFTFVSAYSYGPLPFSKQPNINWYKKPLKNKNIINNYLRDMPTNATIASTNNLGSHLSQRDRIYTIPLGIDKADYVVFLIDNLEIFNLKQIKTALDRTQHNPKYKIIFRNGNFIVYKKIR